MRYKKGFTLIELLVVVAIISLLSSIVFASLSGGRDKAKDANVKANLNNARTIAAFYYDTNGNYGPVTSVCAGVFFLSPSMSAINVSMFNATGTGDYCVSNSTNYAYGHALKTNSAFGWCVDSNGSSKQATTAALAALTSASPVCP